MSRRRRFGRLRRPQALLLLSAALVGAGLVTGGASHPALAGAASPSLSNASFETGNLNGWTVVHTGGDNGGPSATTSYKGKAAESGTYFAIVPAGAQTNSISQSFTASAGQTLSGWAFFQANDYTPFNDTGVLTIASGATSATLFSSGVNAVGSYGSTPWTAWTYTFPATGTWTLQASSTNYGDQSLSSVIGIDLPATPTISITHTPTGSNQWDTTSAFTETITTTGSPTSVACQVGSGSAVAATGSGNSWSAALTAVEGANAVTCTATNGQGSASATDSVNTDTVAPVVTGSPTTSPNSAGWYDKSVTVAWSATDATSGVVSVSPSTVLGEGEAQSPSGSATDKAGNVGTGTVTSPINVDLTPPVTQVSGGAGCASAASWITSLPATICLSASDNLSGVSSIHYSLDGVAGSVAASTGTVTVISEGRHTLTYYATDVAGNVEAAHSLSINVDTSAPVMSLTSSPVLPSSGWFSGSVVVSLACSDPKLADGSDGSGVAGCKLDSQAGSAAAGGSWAVAETVGTEGVHTVAEATWDQAGNTASTTDTVRIDDTPPSVSAKADRPPNGNGWYNAPVTVNFSCSDPKLADGSAGSGVASCPDPVTLSTDGADQTATAATPATDQAGNATTPGLGGISIDQTPPTATFTYNGSSAAAAWYNGPVTVAFNCADALSGVQSCPAPLTLSSEGSDQYVTATVTDNAGNTAEVKAGPINIDEGAPSVQAQLSEPRNSSGWFDTPVTVTWICTDANLADGSPGSGVVDCPAPQTVTTEGADQQVSAQVHDAAGNASPVASVNLSIDLTAPTLTGAPTTGPNSAGWYDSPVTIHWTASDALSGIASVSPDKILGEGANQTVGGSATDVAGNVANATSAPVNVDLTPPVSSLSVSAPGGISAYGWANSLPVKLTLSAKDNLSGVKEIDYDLDGTSGVMPGSSGVVTLTSEGVHGITFHAVDIAGNTEADQSATIDIDTSAPLMSVSTDPQPRNGWYQGSVGVTLTCTDPVLADGSPGSGVTTCQAGTDTPPDSAAGHVVVPHDDTTSTADPASTTTSSTTGDSTTTSTPATTTSTTDGATTTTTLDPSTTTTTLPPPAATATGQANVSGEGRHTVTLDAVDAAGNSLSGTAPVNIDETGPQVVASADRAPNSAGWYDAPVTVSFICTDPVLADGSPGSGVASCPGPVTVGSDGADQSVSGTANDLAGNSTQASLGHLNIDQAGPTVTYTVDGSPTISPWYDGPVTIAFTCTDALSGVAAQSCPQPVSMGSEGRNQHLTETVLDKAGNSTTVTVGPINIDKTAPLVAPHATPAPNAAGWNNGPVSVHWTCSDPSLADGSDGSGVSTCPSDQTITTDGAAQAVTGQATDNAGNVGTGGLTLNIDRVPPTITFLINGSASLAPDYLAPVTVSFLCADSLSGLAPGACPEPVKLGSAAPDQSVTRSVTDLAGNSATADVTGINIVDLPTTGDGPPTTAPTPTTVASSPPTSVAPTTPTTAAPTTPTTVGAASTPTTPKPTTPAPTTPAATAPAPTTPAPPSPAGHSGGAPPNNPPSGATPTGGTGPADSGLPTGSSLTGGADTTGLQLPVTGTSDTTTTTTTTTPTTTTTTPDSAATPSGPSNHVSIQFLGPPGIQVAGTKVTVTGHDYEPGSTVTIYVHSAPEELGTAPVQADGSFGVTVALPPGLPHGAHHIVVSGIMRSGRSAADELPFTIALGGLLGAIGTVPPGPLADDVAYSAASHPHVVLGTTAAATATLGAVSAGLSGGAGSGSGGGRSGGGSGSGSSGGGYLEDVELERSNLDGQGGGRYKTWRWPGTSDLDRHSSSLPGRAAALSPVLGRVLVDGDYLRAIFGGLWTLLCPVAFALGVLAAYSKGWYAVPPALPLFITILGLSVMDSAFGYLAGIGFFGSALLAGHITTGSEIRLGAGVVLIWFAVPLAAAALRPLRRRIAFRADVIWDRAADLVIGGLFAAWAAQKMTEALSGLAGAELPIGHHTSTVALAVIAFIGLRMAVESLALHWYPGRLQLVAHKGELESGNLQVGVSLLVQIALFLFISMPYMGWSWALWVGTALFFSPLVPWLWADRIPKSRLVTKWKPRALTNWTLIIVLGAVLSKLLEHLIHSEKLLGQVGFIVLTTPVLASWALELFEAEEEGDEEEEEVEDERDDHAELEEEHKEVEEPAEEPSRSARRAWALRLAGVPLVVLSVYLVTAGLVGG